MPGLAEIHGQSLQEALDSLLEKHQPISLVSQPFKRICTQCCSVSSLKTLAEEFSLYSNLIPGNTQYTESCLQKAGRPEKVKKTYLCTKQ